MNRKVLSKKVFKKQNQAKKCLKDISRLIKLNKCGSLQYRERIKDREKKMSVYIEVMNLDFVK